MKHRTETHGSSKDQLSVSFFGSDGLKHATRLANVAEPKTFSILYRIEWVETGRLRPPGPGGHLLLSVSCIGSNGLKPEPAAAGSGGDTSFSILYLNEWVGNMGPFVLCCVGLALQESVSGGKGLK